MTQVLKELAEIKEILIHLQTLKKDVLNVKDAAAYLGMSTSYLYKLTADRRIPHFCPEGKKLYFNRQALDNWLQRNEICSKSDTEREAINYIIRNKRQ